MQDYEEEFSSQLVYNTIRCLDGTLLESFSRHDYKTHLDASGFIFMVDGGTDYLRRSLIKQELYEELSVTIGDGHEKVREVISWGTYGKEGTDPFRWITLAEMSTEHIKAVIHDCAIAPYRAAVYNREIRDRDDGIYEHIAD